VAIKDTKPPLFQAALADSKEAAKDVGADADEAWHGSGAVGGVTWRVLDIPQYHW
jgi:hypothetical protein